MIVALRKLAATLAVFGFWCSCHSPRTTDPPAIEFTKLPPSGEGSPTKVYPIEGRVRGRSSNQKIVLYARSGVWWIQPAVEKPWTEISSDSTWRNVTHPGSAYAALLVSSNYHPPLTVETLPEPGGAVAAVHVAQGPKLMQSEEKSLRFAGYEWYVRDAESDRGGTRNAYDSANAWTDQNGFLHLRVLKTGDKWTSAEVRLSRSLGYGSYRFIVGDISHLEPAAVFSIFTWDDAGPAREMNIEISRWGEPTSKNAQYLVQPYFVPANAVRFNAPPGILTHYLHWEPGRVAFKTIRGSRTVDEHEFTSGVPNAGDESIHLNLYVFNNKRHPLKAGMEVIVENFEYLP